MNYWPALLIVAELQTVMMEGVADPRVPHTIWGEPDIVLAPDLLIFEGVPLGQTTGQIPREWVDLPAFLDIFHDDRQVGAGSKDTLQGAVDRSQTLDKGLVILLVT